MVGARAGSADVVPMAGLPSLVLGPGILPGRRPAVTLIGQSAPGFPAGIMIQATESEPARAYLEKATKRRRVLDVLM